MNDNTKIGNVNLLDLRNATEDSVSKISKIGNVNVAITNRKNVPLLTKLSIGNINCMVEVPDHANVQEVIGKLVINRKYIQDQKKPVYPVVIGKVIIDADITAEEIDRGIDALCVVGKLVCPAKLSGIVHQKAKNVTGKTVSYPPYANIEYTDTTFDEAYLSRLKDKSELAVIGSLTVPDILPNKLLDQKVSKLFVSGSIFCHAENAQKLQERHTEGAVMMKIVPNGTKLIQQPLRLDPNTIDALPASKLYCTENVEITADVDQTTFDKKIEELHSEGTIFCPESLRTILAKKCDLLNTNTLFYVGKLWLIEDEEDLSSGILESMPKESTLINYGVLNFDNAVSSAMFKEKVNKLHNYGVIRCTPEQMGAIRAVMVSNKGSLVDSTVKEKEKSDWIGNFNRLAL